MNKTKNNYLGLLLFLFFVFLSTPTASNAASLSGTYVNVTDSSSKIVFEKAGNRVTLHPKGKMTISGKYSITNFDGKTNSILELHLRIGNEEMNIPCLIEGNKISSPFGVFEKKGFLSSHWGKIVIGLIILGIVIQRTAVRHV